MDANNTMDPTALFYVGHHDSSRSAPVESELVDQAHQLGYDMVTTPITAPSFQSRVLERIEEYVRDLSKSDQPTNAPFPTIPLLGPEDTQLGPDSATSSLIAFVSPWIDLASRDPLIAHVSQRVFNLEVSYAAFCGISNIVVPGPVGNGDVTQYARAIVEGLGLGPYVQLHILMPMTGELELDVGESMHLSELARKPYVDLEADDEDPDLFDAWDIWNTIRTMSEYSSRCSVALEVPRHLPNQPLQDRWYSEPVRLLMFPHTSFLRNAKQYPVLSLAHQALLTRFMRLRFPPWLMLCDVSPLQAPEPTPAEAASSQTVADPKPHLRYLRHLQDSQPPRSPIERFGQGYQDFLQSPLQPLSDNLESITYEVFEKDPVKYEWYERAIAAALKDLSRKFASTRDTFNVAVVGSGRGPLVTRALQASRSTGVKVRCWAVEKNPSAYVLLQRRNTFDPLWDGKVSVVKSDMRHWAGPADGGEKVDILVSELLGSFADNELSPECLDGVQHVLDPEHGINIPQSYSAHFTPIGSSRLYSDLLARPGSAAEKWELPYVVMLQQHDYLSLEEAAVEEEEEASDPSPTVRDAWSFAHPVSERTLQRARLRAGGSSDAGGAMGGDGANEHNSRACRVQFKCANRGVCHGLAGYFETVLYAPSEGGEPVELSTNPSTMDRKSKDMISWFPIFFPLKTPIYVPDDSIIEVSMWRQTDDRKVWYEWVVEAFAEWDGKRRRLAGSELHSSRKNGCVM